MRDGFMSRAAWHGRANCRQGVTAELTGRDDAGGMGWGYRRDESGVVPGDACRVLQGARGGVEGGTLVL